MYPKHDEYPSRNAKHFLKMLQRIVDQMAADGYSKTDIAAHILQELHREGLTLQQYEDWKNGYRS